jgi:hypothetical protein
MRSLIVGTLVALSACNGGPGSLLLSSGVPGEVSLRHGQSAEFGAEPVRLHFRDVLGDSRCPVDVVCVWEGDGEVELEIDVGDGPTVTVILHTTGSAGPVQTDVGGYRIALVALSPNPVSTSSIPPSAYIAHLRVERRPAN